jgi:hypothetical protein
MKERLFAGSPHQRSGLAGVVSTLQNEVSENALNESEKV